jgi:hypothetical protein
MSKALATTKYFTHQSYALSPNLVNRDVLAAVPGLNFGPFGSYDNALGRYLIQKAMGKSFFTLIADLDSEVARYQLDKNLP